MKLAIFFLLCSVSLSLQQFYYPGHHDYRMAYFYPRSPYSYYQPIAESPADYSNEHLSSDYADIEGRVPARGSSSSGGGKQRFFGAANLLAALLNTNVNTPISIFPQTTFTSTVLSTTTSIITTASIKSCIGTAQFANIAAVAANPAANPPVAATPATTSTQPCSRRRRGINYEEKMAIEALELVPSPVEPLEYSVPPEMASSSRNRRSENQLEIVSSQDLPIEEEQRSVNNRQKRAVVTVTATVTTFSFVATPVVKSFTLAGPAAAGGVQGLFCLPAGFTVC